MDAGAMTMSASNVARPSARALAACLPRRLPRRRIARVSSECQSRVAFTRETPPIFAGTSRPVHGSRPAASSHAYAR
jgi:hypothetical protein